MRLVIVESPFVGDVERNLKYLHACLRDCLLRGEAPFASHALYTQAGVLDDLVRDERMLGINAGLAWGAKADATVVYTDLGVSTGMRLGVRDAEVQKRPIEYRTCQGWKIDPPRKPIRWGRGIDTVWHRWEPAFVGVVGTVCGKSVRDYSGAWDPADDPPLGARVCDACSAWRPSASEVAA